MGMRKYTGMFGPESHSVRSGNIVLNVYQNLRISHLNFKYVSLQLRVQNAVSAQPCVGKLGISLVLLNFLGCNFRLWFKTP